MTQKNRLFTWLLAALVLLSGFAGLTVPAQAAQQEETSSPEPLVSAEQAEAYVDQLFNGDAEALGELYLHTDELLAALEPAGGFSGLQKSLKSLGKLRDMKPAYTYSTGEYTSFAVPCVFFLTKINIILNADSEGRIGGIVTGTYQEAQSEEETQEAPAYTETELTLPLEEYDGELPGILTIPEGDGPFPAVILVHGSGPQDMDESFGENKPFRDIAHGLASLGVASYRYDKRTYVYGAQMAEDPSLTLEQETIEDAVAAVRLAAGQEMIDPSRIYILGHSLGGQAIPAIAAAFAKEEDGRDEEEEITPAGYIFMAAPARGLVELMREQYDFLYGLNPPQSDEEKAQQEQITEMLDILDDPASLPEGELTGGAYPAYWRYLAAYSQLEEAEDITVPCLVLQGEEDYQVPMEDYLAWKERFGDDPLWQFISYPGLTHLFMEGKKENGPSDYMSAQTVDEQVARDIASFINGEEDLR